MFQFLTHVELSKSMAAILEMPQYVAYQKTVAHIYLYYCGKSPAFNKMCTIHSKNGLGCPITMSTYTVIHIKAYKWRPPPSPPLANQT